MSGSIITVLLTKTPDPQRGVKWDPDPTPYLPLVTTAAHHGSKVTILHDEPLTATTPAQTVKVGGAQGDVFRRKWTYVLERLRTVKAAEVFVTDGPDVTMLRSPWGHLKAGKVYIGSESSRLGNRWMVVKHRHPELMAFIRANKNGPLYNCGLVGGKRADVLAFVERVVETYDYLSATGEPGLDMGVANFVAYELGHANLVTGEQVHNGYKSYRDNGVCWFTHK